MKISIGYEFIDGPWGGGNSFAIQLKNYLEENDIQVVNTLKDEDIDIIFLLNLEGTPSHLHLITLM